MSHDSLRRKVSVHTANASTDGHVDRWRFLATTLIGKWRTPSGIRHFPCHGGLLVVTMLGSGCFPGLLRVVYFFDVPLMVHPQTNHTHRQIPGFDHPDAPEYLLQVLLIRNRITGAFGMGGNGDTGGVMRLY